MKHFKIVIVVLAGFTIFSCTKLDENFRGELEQSATGNIDPALLLTGVYQSINGVFQQGNVWHLGQHSSDETIGPTRGPDWDDNGEWRALHLHTWNGDNSHIRDGFRDLLSAQFAASNMLQFNPSAQQAAEARYIRALTMFCVLDGWNQVPYREDLTDYTKTPVTLKGAEAADFIIGELNAIVNDLPDGSGPAYVASKNAARALLMKTYLNKGAFANRESPTFDNGDMAQVVTLADQIINSGKYSLADNIFDNFAPTNDAISSENIFTLRNEPGVTGGNVRGMWFQVLHYNQNPGGWNGFATLSDFYDKFESGDSRREQSYPGMTDISGIKAGFSIGQQYDGNGNMLFDRRGNPLAFTREVSIKETGNNLEITGIRVHKYPIDYVANGDQARNDYVIFRYADVLLMKAEAQFRSGNTGDALTIVNNIRAKRKASALGSVDLNAILDERGRELYWESWRRQDLIRFGKFLQPWQEKPSDDPKNLLFPIPSDQLAVNPNLEQNPGY